MRILVIHKNPVLTLKGKGQPPISTDTHCPMCLKVAVKSMQSVTRRAHVSGTCRRVQRGEQDPKSFCMRGLDTSFRPGFGKLLQSLVPIVPNHVYRV
jgi:hypothetical protein